MMLCAYFAMSNEWPTLHMKQFSPFFSLFVCMYNERAHGDDGVNLNSKRDQNGCGILSYED